MGTELPMNDANGRGVQSKELAGIGKAQPPKRRMQVAYQNGFRREGISHSVADTYSDEKFCL